MTFAAQVIDFHRQLKPNWKIPKGIDIIYPFSDQETWKVFGKFYKKFFSDHGKRSFLFGINPGRFGAGITGIPFTDPKILEEDLGIENSFPKRNELSSIFIYEMINAMGGPEKFYSQYYITSVCPLGFIAKGKNVNYYDENKLQDAVTTHIIQNIQSQLKFGTAGKVAYSIGQGKNYKYLKYLNDQHGFFKEVLPLPHPRWVMQYRLKRKAEFIDEYVQKLTIASP